MVDLLCAIIEPRTGSMPIARNQGLVMTMLMGNEFIDKLNKKAGDNDFVLKFKHSYDASMVRLLAVLCEGGQLSLIESINKKLFKLEDIQGNLAVLVERVAKNSRPLDHSENRAVHLRHLNTLMSFFVSTYLSETCRQQTRFPPDIFKRTKGTSMWPLLEHCKLVLDNVKNGIGVLGHGSRVPYVLSADASVYIFSTLMGFLQSVFIRLFSYFTSKDTLPDVEDAVKMIDGLGTSLSAAVFKLNEGAGTNLTLAGIRSAQRTIEVFEDVLWQLHNVLKPDRTAAKSKKAQAKRNTVNRASMKHAKGGSAASDAKGLHQQIKEEYLKTMQHHNNKLTGLYEARSNPNGNEAQSDGSRLPRSRGSIHRREDVSRRRTACPRP